MELITQDYASRDSGLAELTQNDTQRITELLMGHSVQKVADDHLQLDDGTMLRVLPNDGCSCGAGDYDLTDLNGCPNIITKVEVVDEERDANEYEDGHTYRVFVFAEDQKINLLTVEGDDGNGYYGTGYSILVRAVKA